MIRLPKSQAFSLLKMGGRIVTLLTPKKALASAETARGEKRKKR